LKVGTQSPTEEARALGRLGDREEALQMLESVRLRLFLEPSPAEAALVSIDLGLVLAEPGLPALARHAIATMLRTFRVARLSLQPMPFA